MQRWISGLDDAFYRGEKRLGWLFLSVLVGAGTYLLAMGYVSGEDFRPGPHGKIYMKLSANPFDFSTPYEVGYRRLAPLLGYLLGLRGQSFLWLTALAAMAIPASIYGHLRSARHFTPSLALGLALLIGLSSVLTIHFIAQGYVDPVYYLLILWAFLLADRSRWSLLFMALAPLAHECTLALWPAWALLRLAAQRERGGSWLPSLLLSLLPLLPWLTWRMVADQVLHMHATFGLSYYFSQENLQNMINQQLAFLPLGAFCALKLGWLLPLQGLRLYRQQQDWLRLAMSLLLLAGVAAQTLIALDLGRLFSLAFPLAVVAAIDLHRHRSPHQLTARVWWLVLLGLPLLTYYVAGSIVYPLMPWPIRALASP